MLKVRDGQSNFTGGIRSNGSLFDGGENEVTELINWRIDPSGSLVVRPGTQAIHDPAEFTDDAVQVYHWKPTAGDDVLIVTTFDGKLYYKSNAESAAYPMSFVDAGTSVAPAHMVGFRDASAEVVYAVTGSGGSLVKFNGTTVAGVGGSVPAGLGQLAVYNRRLFAFNGTTLYWSDLDNGDTLGVPASGGGQAVIRTFGNGSIVGTQVLGSTLFIFHSTGISAFRGWSQDDIDIESGTSVVNFPVGLFTVSGVAAASRPRTADIIDGHIYFIGHDKQAYRLSEAGEVTPIGNRIRDAFADSIQTLATVAANPVDREVWFCATNASFIWVYGIDTGAWYKYNFNQDDSWSWFAVMAARASDVGPTILGASFNDGNVYDMRYTAFPRDAVAADGTGGTNLTAEVQTRHLTFDDPSLVHALRYLYLAIDGVSTGVSASVLDEDGNSTSLGSVDPTGRLQRLQAWGRFNAPRVKLTYSGGGFPVLSDVYLDAFTYNRPT